MKKEIKKVLFITDDIREDDWDDLIDDLKQGEYYYTSDSNKFEFELTMKKDFKINNPYQYHAVLIDYGLVDNEKNMKILEKIYNKGIPMAWIGGLPHCMIVEDVEKMFPEFDFAPTLMGGGIGTDDILFTLYKILQPEIYEADDEDEEDETISSLMGCFNDVEEAINSFTVIVKLRKYCEKLNVQTVEELAPKVLETSPRVMEEYEEEIQDEIQELLEKANRKADIELNELFKKEVGE